MPQEEQRSVLSAVRLAELPALPEGWLYTSGHAYGDRIIHIECPDRGAMSIDFKYRCFSTGWRNPDRPGRDAKKYAGRGWQAALIADAVSSFKAVWGEE